MTNDLHGLTILVTRPGQAGLDLCEEIQSHGGDAIFFPTIAFAPPSNVPLFESSMKQLAHQDWVIFNSPEAVRASFPAIKACFSIWPDKVNIAAIGEGTAKALRSVSLPISIQPKVWSSEGLLDLPVFYAVQNKKIAIIKGEGGRGLLEKVFTERGAKILSIMAYQRVLPSGLNISQVTWEKIDVIIAASFENLKNLQILLGDSKWKGITSVHFIVVSNRIKTLAETLGLETIWIASTPTHDAILTVLYHIAEAKKGP